MDKRIAIIMCVWDRVNLLENTLKLLEVQTDLNFNLYLWNNNILNRERIEGIVNKGYNFGVKTIHYPQNIGGVGRFYMANQISNEYDYVIFIDDDQEFDKNLVKTFKKESKPKSISGWWAYKIHSGYFDRTPLPLHMDGDYIGTGGMVCPIEPFKIPKFFNEFPKKYLFLEDIWLSYYCKQKLQYTLNKSQVNINFTPGEIVRDQSHNLGQLKPEFYNFLNGG